MERNKLLRLKEEHLYETRAWTSERHITHRGKVLQHGNVKIERESDRELSHTSWCIITLSGRMRLRCFARVVLPEQVAPLQSYKLYIKA